MKVLLTGGTGFIGSHTAVCLIESGHTAVLYDNLSNSKPEVVDAVETITGTRPAFVEGDIRDKEKLIATLKDYEIDAVIHFAGLKAVGESVEKPLLYYDNNIAGTVTLLEAMHACGVKKLIFSSSSTVYGTPVSLPLTEDMPTGTPTNPYGRTKLMIEEILRDLCTAQPDFSAVCLRYFNPIGAHASGLIGEDPNGIPNNLLPYVALLPPASSNTFAYSATTIRHPTEQAFATTFMWWIWPEATLILSTMPISTSVGKPLTWERVAAQAFSK